MDTKNRHLTKIFVSLISSFIALETIISILPIQPYRTNDEILIDYQSERIKSLEGGEILMLGDSSLGNAVDEKQISQMTSETCVNLALTAFYGLRGGELVLEKVLAKNTQSHPSAIILMHNPANWKKTVSDRYLRTPIQRLSPSVADQIIQSTFEQLPSVRRSRSYKTLFFAKQFGVQYRSNIYQKHLTRSENIAAEISKVGYMPQKSKIDLNRYTDIGSLGNFTPPRQVEQTLARILQKSQANNIEVFLAGGPVWEKQLSHSTSFAEELHRWLSEAAAEYPNASVLYKGIPGAPDELIGDALNHVNTDGKAQFTKWLGSVLQARLTGDNGPVSVKDWHSR